MTNVHDDGNIVNVTTDQLEKAIVEQKCESQFSKLDWILWVIHGICIWLVGSLISFAQGIVQLSMTTAWVDFCPMIHELV